MSDRLNSILIKPHLTEKGMNVKAHDNVHVFRVRKDANKIEIKAAVEKHFEVKVERVATVNVKGKKKRVGRFLGKTSDWKKAYVTLQAGSGEIPYFEGT
ncbi:MAG: 50S ribosomal protein L23 [Acidobacteria bacterium]|nr:50S ribosomal protein L23 [Acidobacteriota bacterium]MCB9399622.1 50S ribosomal protein L23 [Acidobacteriota bacterium]